VNFKHHPQFFTATILEWKQLLKHDAYKQIILDSMRFLVNDSRVKVFSFVIMPNHIHIIWHISDAYEVHQVQQSFLKYTAQQIKHDLKKNNPKLLEEFRVDAKDRQYQFWERNPRSTDLYTEKVFNQKIDYIHNNPVQEKWKLAVYPEEYKWSSAKFYYSGLDDFGWISHFMGDE
jgi:putative transposase